MFQNDKVESKVENKVEKTVATEQAYAAPQLFAVGQTVELIQGRNGGPYLDTMTGFYYDV